MLIIKGESCVVRVGGGFERLESYLIRNQETELEKIRKMMADKQKTFQAVMIDLLKSYTKDQAVINNYQKYSNFNLPERFTPKNSSTKSKKV